MDIPPSSIIALIHIKQLYIVNQDGHQLHYSLHNSNFTHFAAKKRSEKPMKKTMLVILSFLLLNSFVCLAAEQPNPVRDIDGDELRTGVRYNIFSVIRGAGGGGVTLGRPVNANETCPLNVVQESSDLQYGLPVTFTPVDPKKGVIRVSTDLNIRFGLVLSICIESNVWKLDYSEEIGKYIIATNGVEGNPGPATLSNWFKIEEIGIGLNSYKLVFCPSVCNICRPICMDVGIYSDDQYVRRLVLSDVPFGVRFRKA